MFEENGAMRVRHRLHWCCIAEHLVHTVILLGVMTVRWDIFTKFVHWTLAPKTDMLLEMVYVAILRVICNPCW
jgi:hypothetical protein